MPDRLTAAEEIMFGEAIASIEIHGTGEFRKDLPKALRMVAEVFDEYGGITPLQGLVIGAAARRLDEIAKDLGYGRAPNKTTSTLADELREFRHREGG